MEVKHFEILNEIPGQWLEVKSFVNTLNKAAYFEIVENVLIIDEVDVLERQYLIEIDLSKERISFVDDLVDLERVCNNYNYDNISQWKESLNKLQFDMNKLGFKFYDACNGGNGDYIWYKATIDANDFTKEKLIKAITMWSEFNNIKRDIVEGLRSL